MATYLEWNQAILAFYESLTQRNSRGYLSCDEGSFPLIARQLAGDVDSPLEDFLRAVRGYCIHSGRVQTRLIWGREPQTNGPQSAAFLCALVLAATRMGEDEATSNDAYFLRLREVLDLPFNPEQNRARAPARPPGFEAGDEVPLWNDWNAWVQERGFLPTARPGESRKDKNRGYAIGQSLLRDVDKKSLQGAFRRFRFGTLLDGDEVLARVKAHAAALTLHLRELLVDERAEAAADRIFEVYEEWNEHRLDAQRSAGEKGQAIIGQSWRPFERGFKTLFCGLLRRENPFSGEISYHLLPRFRPHHGAQTGQVRVGEVWKRLQPLDARWWQSVGPIEAAHVVTGYTFESGIPSGQAEKKTAVYGQATLPARDFWILVPDETYGSDDFGSWRPPKLGEPFILLAKKHLFSHLLPLRGRVLDWEGLPEPLEEAPQWAELCMRVVATEWEGLTLPDLELFEALKPRSRLSLSLRQGVRVPHRAGLWLEGYPPQLTVHAVAPGGALCEVELYAPGTKVPFRLEMIVNFAAPLPLKQCGVWLINVAFEGRQTETLVEIADWDSLPMGLGDADIYGGFGDSKWRGARIELPLAGTFDEVSV